MRVVAFRADTTSVDAKTGEYRDPLMKWPLRGAAYTNEIGETVAIEITTSAYSIERCEMKEAFCNTVGITELRMVRI